jgi:bromodomain and PHD finger-containing protein 1
MGIDFDILEHCKKVRADHGPPYTCPIEKCGRTYKSVCGLQYHLKSYDHDNPTPLPPCTPSTPKSKKGRARATPATVPSAPSVPEPLTFEEAQKMVQFDINGQVVRWNINDPLDMVSKEDLSDDDIPNIDRFEQAQEPSTQLPEASYNELDNYNICDAPPRPNAYIRFIEKSVEELDGEVFLQNR